MDRGKRRQVRRRRRRRHEDRRQARRRHQESHGLGDLGQDPTAKSSGSSARSTASSCASIDDTLGLSDFFPVPKPLLAVTTTDTMLPRPYYDLYAILPPTLTKPPSASPALTEKIKVRGGYNAANRDIADLLTADDGKMLPVDGVDLHERRPPEPHLAGAHRRVGERPQGTLPRPRPDQARRSTR